MPRRATAPPPDKDQGKPERQQLDRVLASATFRQVDRLKRFLRFIVSEALAGRGDRLKEYVIGVAFQLTGSFVGPLVYIGAVALLGAFSYSVILGDIHRLDAETEGCL